MLRTYIFLLIEPDTTSNGIAQEVGQHFNNKVCMVYSYTRKSKFQNKYTLQDNL